MPVFKSERRIFTSFGRRCIAYANSNPLPTPGVDYQQFLDRKLELHRDGLLQLLPDLNKTLYQRIRRATGNDQQVLLVVNEVMSLLQPEYLAPLLAKPSTAPRAEFKDIAAAVGAVQRLTSDVRKTVYHIVSAMASEIGAVAQRYITSPHNGALTRDWQHYYGKSLHAQYTMLKALSWHLDKDTFGKDFPPIKA